jgi:GMP synthase-like glutamine amidotransferase
VERLIAAGASVLRTTDEPDMGHYAVVLQDPEGNEFSVVWEPFGRAAPSHSPMAATRPDQTRPEPTPGYGP